MKRSLILTSRVPPPVALRSAAERDLDDLRIWKNTHRKGFFFQGEITPAMQRGWFAGYLTRDQDLMFIVEFEGAKIGCMAYRRLDSGAVDVYNIIASPQGAGRGLMKAGMALLCSHAARFSRDIGCLVLKGNPALSFYERCGFKITGDGGDHHILTLDWTAITPVEFQETEAA
jgi:ribosomal protein S18 acetylase RimI-like enzyme